MRHSFDIATSGAGVEVTKTFEVLKAGFPFVIFRPVVLAFVAPGALKSDLERIKAKVGGS